MQWGGEADVVVRMATELLSRSRSSTVENDTLAASAAVYRPSSVVARPGRRHDRSDQRARRAGAWGCGVRKCVPAAKSNLGTVSWTVSLREAWRDYGERCAGRCARQTQNEVCTRHQRGMRGVVMSAARVSLSVAVPTLKPYLLSVIGMAVGIRPLCGPVSGKWKLKTLDAVAASRVACAGPMLSAGGRALLD